MALHLFRYSLAYSRNDHQQNLAGFQMFGCKCHIHVYSYNLWLRSFIQFCLLNTKWGAIIFQAFEDGFQFNLPSYL